MFTTVNSISAKGVNTFLDLFQNWHHFSAGTGIRVIHHYGSSAKTLTGPRGSIAGGARLLVSRTTRLIDWQVRVLLLPLPPKPAVWQGKERVIGGATTNVRWIVTTLHRNHDARLSRYSKTRTFL